MEGVEWMEIEGVEVRKEEDNSMEQEEVEGNGK